MGLAKHPAVVLAAPPGLGPPLVGADRLVHVVADDGLGLLVGVGSAGGFLQVPVPLLSLGLLGDPMVEGVHVVCGVAELPLLLVLSLRAVVIVHLCVGVDSGDLLGAVLGGLPPEGLGVVAVVLLVALLLPPPENLLQRLQSVRLLPPGGDLLLSPLELLAELGHLPPLLPLHLVVSV